MVARGDQQTQYVDFGEVFAPTVTASCVKMLAAFACEQDLEIFHSDIEQAFVNSKLEDGLDVYMKLPKGCGLMSGMIVKLAKSLYGLKQASRQWHAHLTRCLLYLGFEKCLADACVFRLIENGLVVLTLVVHVDDVFSVGKKERYEKFCRDLGKMVPVKDLGPLTWYSGCFYERDWESGRLTISQETYALELAAEYGIKWGKSVPLGVGVGVKLGEFDLCEEDVLEPFRALIGSLMWLAVMTRPDIANAVRAIARYCAHPKLRHWEAARDVLGYVRRTSSMGISFSRGSPMGVGLQGFADADFASKATDRRSVSGCVVMCCGGVIAWFSRTQKCVTLSTTEAEYVALGDAVKELLFIRQVWLFFLPSAPMPLIPVFEDNEGAIALASNPISNNNSKHIDTRHHFLRERIARREIEVIHVGSAYQHADFLTKALSREAFEFHRDIVMNVV